MKCGIIGLPNVGKSTLFNLLTSLKAPAANYPFCTVDPNIGRVSVPDKRLNILAQIFQSEKIVPTNLEFVDIAGLIRGAHKGEGLGNHFLSHIRDVDALLHVVRAFEDPQITHTEQTINPLRDIELINTELLLADIATCEKKQEKLIKSSKAKSKTEATTELILVKKILKILLEEKPASKYAPEKTELAYFNSLRLLTAKPVLYVCNISERVSNPLKLNILPVHSVLNICIGAEGNNSSKDSLSKKSISPLECLIQKAYALLNLITFFTAGKTESRAWTIEKDTTARKAAGKIHSDFEKKFIKAEVYSFADMEELKSIESLRQAGKYRLEGQNYLVQDGDVMLFKFNR